VYLCLQCYKKTAAEVSGEREGRERKKQELRDGRRREVKKEQERRGETRPCMACHIYALQSGKNWFSPSCCW